MFPFLIAEILLLCDAYNLTTREFYFDRSPKIFENILGLYRKGELHLTENVCPRDFLGELEYWGLSALHLGSRKSSCITFSYIITLQNLVVPTLSSEQAGCYQSLTAEKMRRKRWVDKWYKIS